MLHPAFEDRKMFTVYILCLIFEPSRFSYQYSCALVSNKTQKKIGTRLKFARADASRGYLMLPNGTHLLFKILVSCNGFEIARDVLCRSSRFWTIPIGATHIKRVHFCSLSLSMTWWDNQLRFYVAAIPLVAPHVERHSEEGKGYI